MASPLTPPGWSRRSFITVLTSGLVGLSLPRDYFGLSLAERAWVSSKSAALPAFESSFAGNVKLIITVQDNMSAPLARMNQQLQKMVVDGHLKDDDRWVRSVVNDSDGSVVASLESSADGMNWSEIASTGPMKCAPQALDIACYEPTMVFPDNPSGEFSGQHLVEFDKVEVPRLRYHRE